MILQGQIKKYGEMHQSDIIRLKKAIGIFLDVTSSLALSPIAFCLRLLNSIKDITIWLIAAVIGLIKLTAQKVYRTLNSGAIHLKNLVLALTGYVKKDIKNNRSNRPIRRQTGNVVSPSKAAIEFSKRAKKPTIDEKIETKRLELTVLKEKISTLNKDSIDNTLKQITLQKIEDFIPKLKDLTTADEVTKVKLYELMLGRITARNNMSYAKNNAELRQIIIVALSLLEESLDRTDNELQGLKEEVGEQLYKRSIYQHQRDATKAMKLGIKLEQDVQTLSYDDIKNDFHSFMAKVGVGKELAETNDISRNDETDSTISMSSNEDHFEAGTHNGNGQCLVM